MLDEPLESQEARRLFREILSTGRVLFSSHALEEMSKDDLVENDCYNVLRGGVVDPAEFIKGSWRYRVRSHRLHVVVALRSETTMVVVTAWRAQR